MRYLPTVYTSTPWTLADLQVGQWIDYEGVRGRFVANRNGINYIAWSAAATRRFSAFVAAVKAL